MDLECGRELGGRVNLLSTCLQFLTFVRQSQVWRSTSNARPVGHLTDANRVTPFSALSHLIVQYIHGVKYTNVIYMLLWSMCRLHGESFMLKVAAESQQRKTNGYTVRDSHTSHDAAALERTIFYVCYRIFSAHNQYQMMLSVSLQTFTWQHRDNRHRRTGGSTHRPVGRGTVHRWTSPHRYLRPVAWRARLRQLRESRKKYQIFIQTQNQKTTSDEPSNMLRFITSTMYKTMLNCVVEFGTKTEQ